MTNMAEHFIGAGEITSQHFDAAGNTAFRFVAGDLAMPVTLMECMEKPESAGPDSKRTPFLLVFRAEVDEAHLMQQTIEFHGSIHGLEKGVLDTVMIHRMMRPANLPEGAYYQVMFN